MRTISRSCTDPKRRIQNPWKNQTYWIHINYQKQTSKNPPLQPFCKHNYSPFPEKNSLDSRMTIIFFPRDSKYFPRRILSVQIVSKYVFIVPKKTPVFSNAEFVVAKNDFELSDLAFIEATELQDQTRGKSSAAGVMGK